MKKVIQLFSIGLITLFIPLLNLSPYVMRILILSGIYIILSLSLNLLTGYTGQVSLGHAAFYGIGAYTSSLLAIHYNLNFIVTLFLGSLVAALFGLLLGLPTLRLNGTYLSIITLGFCEITRLVELNWINVTKGPMGITNIPSPKVWGTTIDSDKGYFYLIIFLVAITTISINNIIKSKTGRALVAIREDEIAAVSMGINIFKYKIIAFTVSAFFAGLAGSFYAHYVTFIDPKSFNFDESIQILSIVILGGMGNIPGTILASLLLVSIPELLREFQQYRMLCYGLLLMFMMILRPEGLFNINIVEVIKSIKIFKKKGVVGNVQTIN